MRLLQQILREIEDDERRAQLRQFSLALEHQTYKVIPGTQNSLRIDAENKNTKTLKHAHVYARPHGGGRELYSVNVTGTGHDGSSGTVIPRKHAEHLRSIGFRIPDNLALESLDIASLSPDLYEICVLLEDDV